jgi:hypothetical protein
MQMFRGVKKELLGEEEGEESSDGLTWEQFLHFVGLAINLDGRDPDDYDRDYTQMGSFLQIEEA